MSISLDNIKKRFLEVDSNVPENVAERISIQLLKCTDNLEQNIIEWVAAKPFSDVWIRNKYCLNAVLKIRGNPSSPLAIADAILALNAYAENAQNEHLIWQKRM